MRITILTILALKLTAALVLTVFLLGCREATRSAATIPDCATVEKSEPYVKDMQIGDSAWVDPFSTSDRKIFLSPMSRPHRVRIWDNSVYVTRTAKGFTAIIPIEAKLPEINERTSSSAALRLAGFYPVVSVVCKPLVEMGKEIGR